MKRLFRLLYCEVDTRDNNMDATCPQDASFPYSNTEDNGPNSIRRVVRPFTEKQLLYLYPVDELDNNESFVDAFLQVSQFAFTLLCFKY